MLQVKPGQPKVFTIKNIRKLDHAERTHGGNSACPPPANNAPDKPPC